MKFFMTTLCKPIIILQLELQSNKLHIYVYIYTHICNCHMHYIAYKVAKAWSGGMNYY